MREGSETMSGTLRRNMRAKAALLCLPALFVSLTANCTGLTLSPSSTDPGGTWNKGEEGYRTAAEAENYAENPITLSGADPSWYGWYIDMNHKSGGYIEPKATYTVHVFGCPATGPSVCTMAKSTSQLTGGSFYVDDVWGDWGEVDYHIPVGGVIPAKSSVCVALTSSKGSGPVRPGGQFGLFCSDAKPFPDEIPSCHFDMGGSSPTIDLGSVEREKIKTEVGSSGDITQSIKLKCTNQGGSQVTSYITFKYSGTTTISGSTLVSTNLKGTGVAVYYDGKPVVPGHKYEKTFDVGSPSFDMEFALVRDPTKPLAEIGTGSFSASASIIMNIY